ncbi:MAG: M1 family metallopeptidase, partial [Flavobacteriaceae bacterium]|nr:M1 family metallopeptidase [Flavobacteriaceae bacterium]
LIHKISKNGKDLKFDYDGSKLKINLANIFTRGEQYTVYIKYTARPEEVQQKGSAAITDAKGLYFIDPDGTDPKKPTQIWTQGETESSSCWFPTIDAPNQKTSQEIYMTVPDQYVTLSNGLLKEQTSNGDGTRTDYWKFDQKHAPYLFFMGVGEYSIIKDKWKDIAVDYYVEKEYEPYAQEIFGLTPEMIQFFSDYTGVEYLWPKYAQIVGRDYVSGAMENTTAVIHGEMAYQTSGDLIDKNSWESVIAHELFHHWFGDLVTAESWSNLTVNESFANYSEYLWFEHKYGSDYADAHRHDEIKGYMSPENELKDLVRFHYNSREDMFDGVSYNKGGTILHMLRDLIGDKAFKESLKVYLNDNKFGTGEAHQLRLAFEKVTGKDLNWFFNQWYFSNGHPKLDIKYIYSDEVNLVTVQINQTQNNMFEFPLAIDVYEDAQPKRYPVWIDKKSNTFSFKYNKKPKLVNVDGKRVLLAEISDNKTIENYIHLYTYGEKYEDRREAIEALADNQSDDAAFKTLIKAMNDSFYGLRILAIDKVDISKTSANEAIKVIEKLATSDEKTLVQAKAISKLELLDNQEYGALYKKALESPSNSVKGNALRALYKIDKASALSFASSIKNEIEKESFKDALIPVYILDKTEAEIPFVAENLIAGMFFIEDKALQNTYKEGFQWVAGSDNEEATQNLVNAFVQMGNQYKQYGADKVAIQVLEQVLAVKNE